jgi:hypothetical protein
VKTHTVRMAAEYVFVSKRVCERGTELDVLNELSAELKWRVPAATLERIRMEQEGRWLFDNRVGIKLLARKSDAKILLRLFPGRLRAPEKGEAQ